MKILIFLAVFTVLFLSCHQDISVNFIKEPGLLTGKVVPLDIDAVVELYQGGLVKQTTVDAHGYFMFDHLTPGYYILRVQAENYGKYEKSVHVYDGEGRDIGTIELSRLPYPLRTVTPYDGAIDVSIRTQIRLDFSMKMDIASLMNAFDINPEVENLNFSSSYETRFIIKGDFKLKTQYTLTINSTAQTQSGENMEFPYSSTFETEPFKITNFSYNTSPQSGFFPVYFYFNSEINVNDFLDYLTIEPHMEIYYNSSYNDRIYIYPTYCWMPDTTIIFRISREFKELGGAPLEGDNSFAVITPPLLVYSTIPNMNQHYVSLNTEIYIKMNNLIDESSISSAVSITPAVDYDVTTYVYTGSSTIRLYPHDSLISNTMYTITIDTTLKDFYGRKLKQPYFLHFKTK